MNYIQQLLGVSADFKVFDYSALKRGAQFRRFDYKILPPDRKLRIEGARMRNIDTVFGGSADEPLLLDESQVNKLPHDLVHCSISGDPEGGVVLMGYTPDVCIPCGNGQYDVLEITTVESGRLNDVVDRMCLKIEKYKVLTIGQRACVRSMNFLIVTPDHVYDLSGALDDSLFTTSVKQAYNYGLEIKRAYAMNPGFVLDSRAGNEELKGLKEVFQSFKPISDAPIPRSFYSDPVPPHPNEWKISKDGIEDKYMSFEEYELMMRSRSTQRPEGMGTIVHVPMVTAHRNTTGVILAEASELESNVYADLFNCCLAKGLRLIQQHSFEVLRMVGEMDNDQKPKKQPQDGPDMFNITLDEDSKLDLALRGLLAKKNNMIHHPEVMEKRANDKLDVNYDEDLGNLVVYLDRMACMVGEPSLPLKELDHCFAGKYIHDYRPLVEDLSRISEVDSCNLLELMFKEIEMNLVRWPRDDATGRQFLFRLIPGYDAFVVFRTTAPSGQDQSHIFYALFFKGEELAPGVFEDTYELDNGWKHTLFLSTDQNRLSQMQGLACRSVFHWASMIDEQGGDSGPGSDCLSPDITLAAFTSKIHAFRVALLILLEDKQVTSSTLQDFRYYYMELNTAFRSSKIRAQKLTSKLPVMVRSRLLLYLIRRLIEIHKALPDGILNKLTGLKVETVEQNTTEDGDDWDPDSMNFNVDIDTDKAAFYISAGILTPFGFEIKTPADLVRAMYMGYMHNKNESFKGHGVVKMLEKTLKMAYKFSDLKLTDERAYCCSPLTDPDSLKPFQHSEPALKLACHLLKARICDRAGIKLVEYNSYIEEKILRFCLKSTLEDLASTKASTIPFDDLTISDTEGVEFKGLGRKRKCIEAILSQWGEFKSVRTAMNITPVAEAMKSFEGGRLKVTLFKKNQIGGTREIYVLTMRGRILVKVFSDLFRAICELHPSEVLTKPENKQVFVSQHYNERRKLAGKHKVTYKVSEDKTTWAQLFNLWSFASMSRELLPECFHEFSRSVLNSHKNKHLQLPKSLVEQFIENPLSELSSEFVDRLKAEFLGTRAASVSSGRRKSSFKNSIDMMQGILHYPSSCYHLLMCEYKTMIIKRWMQDHSLDSVVDFLVSSDDEGDLISFSSDDEEHLQKCMGRFHNAFSRIEHTVDKLFGVETSDKKTSRTYADIFEINSEFYFGNTCQRALSKFENNAIFLEPGESLHLQISSMYAKLHELRINGASGTLCHWASIMQCVNFSRCIGISMTTWYEPGLYRKLTETLTTASGYYMVMNEVCAGLMDSTFVNWRAVREKGVSSAKVIYYLTNYALPLSTDEFVSAKFSIYPKKSYKDMLRRLGLEPGSQSAKVDKELFETLLRGSRSLKESRRVIEYMVLTPSIARSMAFLNRTHVDRMAPYVLWASLYKDSEADHRISLPSLIKKAQSLNPDPQLLSIRTLFPMSDQFERINRILDSDSVISGTKPYRRLYTCHLSPQYYTEECLKNMKEVLSYVWFAETPSLSRRQCLTYFAELQSLMPWIKDSLDETSRSMPLKNLHELYAFIQSTRSATQSFSALVRGRPRKSFSSVQSLLFANTFSRRDFHVAELKIPEDEVVPGKPTRNPGMLVKVSDRIRAWDELLSESKDEPALHLTDLLRLFREDMAFCASLFAEDEINTVHGISEDHAAPRSAALIAGRLSVSSFAALSKECVVYLSLQERKGRTWTGNYSYIHKKSHATSLISKVGDTVSVTTNVSAEEFRKTYRIEAHSYTRGKITFPDVVAESVKWIKGNIVLELSDDAGYMDIPKFHQRASHLTRPQSPHPVVLEKWLSRIQLNDDEVHSLLVEHPRGKDLMSTIARVILKIAKGRESEIKRTRLKEKVAVASELEEVTSSMNVNERSPMELMMMMADAFEGEDANLENFLDAFDVLVDDSDDDWHGKLAGMEMTALEGFMSMVESNKTLYMLLRGIRQLKMVPPRFLSPEVRESLVWLEKL